VDVWPAAAHGTNTQSTAIAAAITRINIASTQECDKTPRFGSLSSDLRGSVMRFVCDLQGL
jgi:hypothetical protein